MKVGRLEAILQAAQQFIFFQSQMISLRGFLLFLGSANTMTFCKGSLLIWDILLRFFSARTYPNEHKLF